TRNTGTNGNHFTSEHSTGSNATTPEPKMTGGTSNGLRDRRKDESLREESQPPQLKSHVRPAPKRNTRHNSAESQQLSRDEPTWIAPRRGRFRLCGNLGRRIRNRGFLCLFLC